MAKREERVGGVVLREVFKVSPAILAAAILAGCHFGTVILAVSFWQLPFWQSAILADVNFTKLPEWQSHHTVCQNGREAVQDLQTEKIGLPRLAFCADTATVLACGQRKPQAVPLLKGL